VATALAAGALLWAWTEPAGAESTPSASVTLAILSPATTVADLGRAPRMSPGVLSAGIGEVPSEQTFLDTSQGNRIDEALYDRSLPGLYPFARQVPGWPGVVERAAEAPADLVPGSLAHRLSAAGLTASAEQPLRAPALVAVDPSGIVLSARPGECLQHRCPGLSVVYATEGELGGHVARLRGDDLLIALSAPPPGENQPLPHRHLRAGDSARTSARRSSSLSEPGSRRLLFLQRPTGGKVGSWPP
jgi:hypothetical protein